MADLQRLSADLAAKLDAGTLDNIGLVGGQALAFWVDRYVDELSDAEEACLVSHDIDFYGQRGVVVQCAWAWKGCYLQPQLGDATPNTGIIKVDAPDGEEIKIDFLGSLHGVQDKELARGFDFAKIRGTDIRILTPALCLKSRIHNIVGLNYSQEQIDRESERIPLVAQAAAGYIRDLLDHSEHRKAYDWANLIIDTAGSSDGISAAVRYGVEPLSGIPADHDGWDRRFLDIHLAVNQEKILHRRRSLRERLDNLKRRRLSP